jgi:hypothetical protein
VTLGLHAHRRYLDRAGAPIGRQMASARRAPDLVRVLPDAFALELGVWLAMREKLRTTAGCRVVFDGLAAGLRTDVDRPAGEIGRVIDVGMSPRKERALANGPTGTNGEMAGGSRPAAAASARERLQPRRE